MGDPVAHNLLRVMVPGRFPAAVTMAKLSFLALLLLLPVVGAAAFGVTRWQNAEAAGPCGTSHDAMDSEEFQFLALLQAWRDANIPGSSDLTPSGPLNAASAWFAQWQVEHGSPGGHVDDLGREFTQRALDCGWPLNGGIGEGIAAYVGAGNVSALVSHQDALDLMSEHLGSGIYIPDPQSSYSAKCVGIGIAENAEGTAVAWVVLIAWYYANSACPEPQLSPIDGEPTVTTTPSATPTATSSPTPTASPTPDTFHSWAPGVTRN